MAKLFVHRAVTAYQRVGFFLSALLNLTLPPTIPSGIRKNEVKILSMVKRFGFLVFVFVFAFTCAHASICVCVCMHKCRSDDNLWGVCVHSQVRVCTPVYVYACDV